MNPIDEIKKCCGTTCDRPAVVALLEKQMFCVIEWSAGVGVSAVVGPLPEFDAKMKAREMAKNYKEINGEFVYASRDKFGAYCFYDDTGEELLTSLTVSPLKIPY